MNEIEAAMFSRNNPKSDRNEGPVPILGTILIMGVLLMIFAIGILLLNRLKESRSSSQQDIPAMLIPTAAMPPAAIPPTALQASYFPVRFPVILSGSISGSEQIWKVTNINNMGYELGGQRYDLATFTRIDGQDTAQGYCINPGWDIPDVGREYLLNERGTFVPLQQPGDHPLQSFLKLQ